MNAVQPKRKETHNVAFNDQPVSIPANNRDIYDSDSADTERYDDDNDDDLTVSPNHFSKIRMIPVLPAMLAITRLKTPLALPRTLV